MNRLIANMLVNICCEDDKVLFEASVKSIAPVCDHMVFNDTSEDSKVVKDIIQKINIDYYTRIISSPKIDDIGFAEARNLMLERDPEGPDYREGDYILWVDSDEVHFTEQLQELKDKLLGNYDDISAHFIHFTLGTNAYEKFEKRTIIFRKTEFTRWYGKVHEAISHSGPSSGKPVRSLFCSAYHYHHYGYVRDQEIIYSRWKQYGLLEGQEHPSVEQEYPDHKVLEHRRESLMPYFGEYPSAIPQEWIKSKMIAL